MTHHTLYAAWHSDPAGELWRTLPPPCDPHDPAERGRRMRQFRALLHRHSLAAERPYLTGIGPMAGLAAALNVARITRRAA